DREIDRNHRTAMGPQLDDWSRGSLGGDQRAGSARRIAATRSTTVSMDAERSESRGVARGDNGLDDAESAGEEGVPTQQPRASGQLDGGAEDRRVDLAAGRAAARSA